MRNIFQVFYSNVSLKHLSERKTLDTAFVFKKRFGF